MCPRIGQPSYVVIFRTDCIDILYIANSVGLDNRGGSPVGPSTEQLQNPQQTTVVDMVWKQVGNCLQNLKFTMISIDFIVRNKLKQSNVCKEINFINYINVYLNKKQSVSCLKWSTQYMRGICFIWFPLLMNELMVKSWKSKTVHDSKCGIHEPSLCVC